MKEERRHGVVYVLPNLFTSANLLCGFYAIVNAMNLAPDEDVWDLRKSAIAVIVGALLDGMDGRVARRTGTASRFGREYDSLVDLISFGVAPALVIYVWALRDFHRVGWLAAFLFIACGALRLARFNVQASASDKGFFTGLPIPMAALMAVGTLLIWDGTPIGRAELLMPGDVRYSILGLVYLLAFLMVSRIPYRSFKNTRLARQHPFLFSVIAVFALAVLPAKPWWILYFLGAAYILSGPVEKYLLPFPMRAVRRVVSRKRVRRSLDRMDRLSQDPESSDRMGDKDPRV